MPDWLKLTLFIGMLVLLGALMLWFAWVMLFSKSPPNLDHNDLGSGIGDAIGRMD